MIVFFDKYTECVRKLQETMYSMRQDVRIVALSEDGELPEGIVSPYEFFAYRDHHGKLVERDLFYNFIKLPEFWEVRLLGWMGGIFDMGREKGRIYFKEPAGKRNVQRVEWHMDDGWVYKIDHYNKYGLKYISDFLDHDGNIESRVFYSDKNQETVVEQPVNHIISLLENGAVKKCFTSYMQFMEYYLKEAGLEEEMLLFVQQEKTFEILELASDRRNQWKRVLFMDDDLLNKYIDLGGKNGSRFYAMPNIYPDNHAGNEAMILTASDRIEGLEDLIRELPDLIFHVAANTQVSDKLRKLGELENVKVYPQISMQDLDRLWNVCDFYLDINHYREIYDAVHTAHDKNLLILGFEDTVHHREWMIGECIFTEGDYENMVLTINVLRKTPALVRELLAVQQKKMQELWGRILEGKE